MQRHVCLDQRPDVLLFDRALVLSVARAAHAECHRLVLQIALAALIADRAIERMVDQQEFHHAFARLFHQCAPGRYDLRRAVPVRRQIIDDHRARGDGLGAALHHDKAHAAVASDRQALMIAEARDLGAGLLAGMHQRGPVLDLDRPAVDDQLLGHWPSLVGWVSAARVRRFSFAVRSARNPTTSFPV